MKKYTDAIDRTINDFKAFFPDCYDFIQKDIERMRSETLKAIERYQRDVSIKGVNEVMRQLDTHLQTATEIYDIGHDFLQPNNGRDFKSAASNILTGMLEMTWIKEFKQSCGKPKDIEPLTDFESLFKSKYKDKIPEFIQMLRGGESGLITNKDNDDLPLLISTENEWLGVSGAARTFCEVLRDNGVFIQKARPSSKDVRRIMRDTFKGLPEYYYKEVGIKGGEYRDYFQSGIDTIIAKK